MSELANSTNLRGMPDLFLLGVREHQQSKAPNSLTYPDKFNTDCRKHWQALFARPDFVAYCKSLQSVEEMWQYAVNEFLVECRKNDVLPFSTVTRQSLNDSTIAYLTRAREELVRFVDENEFFGPDRLRVRRACREYKRTQTGLFVHAFADCFYLEDPTFERWLTKAPAPRLLYSAQNRRYERAISANITVWVRYLAPTRIRIGYIIQVPSSVSIPGVQVPTKKQVDTFIDRLVWCPIIRAHRFRHAIKRLF